jgi:hypothetical protein
MAPGDANDSNDLKGPSAGELQFLQQDEDVQQFMYVNFTPT